MDLLGVSLPTHELDRECPANWGKVMYGDGGGLLMYAYVWDVAVVWVDVGMIRGLVFFVLSILDRG